MRDKRMEEAFMEKNALILFRGFKNMKGPNLRENEIKGECKMCQFF